MAHFALTIALLLAALAALIFLPGTVGIVASLILLIAARAIDVHDEQRHL